MLRARSLRRGRLQLARCIVEDGWPIARAAEGSQVARADASRWPAGYRELGPAGDGRPFLASATVPRTTPQPVIARYTLRKELWAFTDDRIAVRCQYGWHMMSAANGGVRTATSCGSSTRTVT
jgi:nuclear transport factor 2 (NTF2) superfamily protein